MKTIINTARALSLAAAFCLTACTDDYDCNLTVEEPADVALATELAQYDVLKTYAAGQLPIGAAMSTSAWGNKDVAYSALVDNFTAVDVNGSFPATSLYSDAAGAYDFSSITSMADDAAGLDVYGGALVAATSQRKAHYEDLIAPTPDLEHSVSGKTTVADFESDAIGTAYAMTGNSQAVIDTDPSGITGHVLHVGTNSNGANWSWAKIHVTLPKGVKLGICTNIIFDLRHLNNGQGQYGAGMQLRINDKQYGLGTNAAGLGAGNAWSRGISIDLKNGQTPACTLDDAQNALTEFDLSIGSASGSAQYLLDNIIFVYEMNATIEKTPAEKKAILAAEMKKLVAGMIGAGVGETGAVKSWDLITEPLAAEDGESDFSWRKYMGDDDYARIAMRIARDTLAAIPADKQPTLYVEQTLDQNNGSDIVTKASALVAKLRSWEADGTTRFDGINIRLHAVCSKDASVNAANEQAISSMLAALATSGKAVRLSDIAIAATDESGAAIALNKMEHADKLEVAAFMTAIVSAYKAAIPASQQGGLVFRTLNGSDSLNTLAPWSSAWSRTEMYEGIVNGLK